MSLSKITTRFSRTILTHSRSSGLLFGRHGSRQFHNSRNFISSRETASILNNLLKNFADYMLKPHEERLSKSIVKVILAQVSSLQRSSLRPSGIQWFRFSSSASPEPNEKETVAQSGNGKENKESNEAPSETEECSDDKSESVYNADFECDLSREDLIKLVMEKEELLSKKLGELELMKDKVLRSYADMENMKERTRRESENSKKFAIQNFAKSLLDVADNLGRASSAAKDSFSKIDATEDAAGAVKQLKTLLEGVEMTEKQLGEVFKKFGLEKYDPAGEEFDPNRHNAVFQIPDATKPEGLVAAVLKAGYVLHDRVIRPAEVGVTVAVNEEAE